MYRPLNIRSLLFTPADQSKLFEKAIASEAGLIIFDLEDAVAPNNKSVARKSVKDFFAASSKMSKNLGIRINSLKTKEGIEDLLFLSAWEILPDAIVIPKLESHQELRILNSIFPNISETTSLIGLIETAYAIDNLNDIVKPAFGLSAVLLGAADLSADLGCTNTFDNLFYARSKLVNAASSKGIPAIDSPFFDLKDMSTLERESHKAASMGFMAKAAIHPAQLVVINHIFTPTDEEIKEAVRIIEIAEKGVGTFNGKMVDKAMAAKAKKVIERYKLLNS